MSGGIGIKLARVLWLIAVIWFHSALVAIVIYDYFAFSNHPYPHVRQLVKTFEGQIDLFICGGLLAHGLNILALLIMERKVREVGSLRQLPIYFLAGLPFYGPFYYRARIKRLRSQRNNPN